LERVCIVAKDNKGKEIIKDLDLSKMLRNFREEQGLSQYQLADLVGVNRSYINQIEMGKYKSPPWTVVKAIYNNVLRGPERDQFLDALSFEIEKYLRG
jgi:transcriptional regulator with XRE-family HTH domain